LTELAILERHQDTVHAFKLYIMYNIVIIILSLKTFTNLDNDQQIECANNPHSSSKFTKLQ